MVKFKVRNLTPYTWHYTIHSWNNYSGTLYARQSKEEDIGKAVHCYLKVRYGNNGWDTFSYEFNSFKGPGAFTIKESWNRSLIELQCNTESNVPTCRNYGKEEEDRIQQQVEQRRLEEEERRRQEEMERQQQEEERRRQEKMEQQQREEERRRQEKMEQQQREEERRRQEEMEQQRRREEEQQRQEEEERRHQERLERERRIQQDIEKERELLRRKMSMAQEKQRQKLSLKGQQRHHQRTHMLQQVVEDDAAAIERDELGELKDKFEELLKKYDIIEDESMSNDKLENRMKNLQNELTLHYFGELQLSMWCQLTMDRAISQGQQSLTVKFSILTAVAEVTLAKDLDTYIREVHQPDQKYDFLIHLVEQLYSTNPTAAQQLVQSIFDVFPEVSEKNKGILGQILFNEIWTPLNILLFLRGVSGMDRDQTTSILHTVLTNRMDFPSTLSALKDNESVMSLQGYVEAEGDKDADTILNEMRNEIYPEKVLSIMEEILGYMTEELPKHSKVDLDQAKIDEAKQMIKSLDLNNPDLAVLKEVLVRMSIAVQDCSTIFNNKGEKIEGYFPRLTQLASLLMLLLAKLTGKKGILLEIGTGEGKSCILAMFATIQAIRGTKVDIVTSSPVLARRDQEEWKKLHDKFDVTSSVVPPTQIPGSSSKSRDSLLQQAYRKQIVYGTIGTFAADVLRQEFEKDVTRGERRFDMVIVDEVDYMTLDNGVQVTFLSHEASGLKHLDQVLASIWSKVSMCQPIEMEDTGEIEWATGIQHFHKAAKLAVMGPETSEQFSAFDILLPGVQFYFYSQEDVDTFMQALAKTENDDTTENRTTVDTFMAKVGVDQQFDLITILEKALENTVTIDCYSVTNNKATLVNEKKLRSDLNIKMLLLNRGQASEIMSEKKQIEATVSELKSKIQYSNNSQPKSEFIVIPSFLKKYLENRLPVFVENALKAIMMSQGREYMIDQAMDAVGDNHLYHAIIPVDFQASGVLEKNKRWGDGLQQFLEMKHQLAITPLSTVTNYLSNFHYLKKYLEGNGIFGVSGTLGGKADKQFLKKQYETNCYTIPAHRHKKVVELPAIQVNGQAEWMEILCNTASRVADSGQVVLVVCEDVKTANELQDKMERGNPHSPITLYTISEKHNIECSKFTGGHIIIATNLGGRGTDIKVDQDVNLRGGLFVLLTHYPGSRRVEKQIFGRTGRKGNPGMVQMILSRDNLAPAYQDQPVEIMRQLREEYEVQRIKDMETDELLEINTKEELFDTFCKFLNRFDNNFTQQEREVVFEKMTDDPDLKNKDLKFDYHPALNALKETWALWLTLHEEHINRHDNINVLKADLCEHITKKGNLLLKGESHNFYDHIKQAIGRTDLHCREKKCDFGAKSYWKDVEECDPFYSSVALYNQAFITINMAKDGYKTEACGLLKRAKTTVDVYLSETTNTMVSFQMASRGNFVPHHEGKCNFLKQMDSRMSIFKAWTQNIALAVKKLEELDKEGTAMAEVSSVFSLSGNQDYITANELTALYENGLCIVFEVKKKPEFSFDALICFFIGMCQVVLGVLVCSLSFGTATQIGLGLISEGVNDMFEGIMGMATGSFSWATWAISKSISIGMSLLSAGFSTIKKVTKSVYQATKGLLNGTKTLSSVANDVIGAGKHAFKSAQGAAKSLSKETFKGASKKLASPRNMNTAFKEATKYAVKEVGKQGFTVGMTYIIEYGIEAFFKNILDNFFKEFFTSKIREDAVLAGCLTEYISSAVPKEALQNPNDYKIDAKLEEHINGLVQVMTNVIPDLMTDSSQSQVREVIGRLSEVCNEGTTLVAKNTTKTIAAGVKLSVELAKFSTTLAQMVRSIPTEDVRKIIVLELKKEIEKQQLQKEKYDEDGRHKIPDVIRLKNELHSSIADSVSQSFIETCAGHTANLMIGLYKIMVNEATGKVASNVLAKFKTKALFQDQQHKHKKESSSQKTGKDTETETETKELLDYADNIGDMNRPATDLDFQALTKSDLLQGQGIQIILMDQQGKKLSQQSYPGKDPSAGNITLALTKEPEKTDSDKGILSKAKYLGVQSPYSGHFDIIQDGKVILVDSEDQNCFYHAVVKVKMAKSMKTEDEIKHEAMKLRNNVKEEVKRNIPVYREMVKTDKANDIWQKKCGKYAIVGGGKPKRKRIGNGEYEDDISPMKKNRYGSSGLTEYDIAYACQLGKVGPYKRPFSKTEKENHGIVKADHIPPILSLVLARKHPQIEYLQKKNPKFYDVIMSTEIDKSEANLFTIQVLENHHRDALTTGSSKEAVICRNLLAEILVSGDVEKSLKQSFIMANPTASQQLRNNAGKRHQPTKGRLDMSTEGTETYYKAGFNQMLNNYEKEGIIDQNQLKNLKSWVADEKYLDQNTPEYTNILTAIK